MFSTLLAREFRAHARTLALVRGTLVIVGLLGLCGGFIDVAFVRALALIVGIGCFLLLAPATYLVLAIAFWRRSFGREAALTHSIPVRGRTVLGVSMAHALLNVLIALAEGVGGFFVLLCIAAATSGRPFVDAMAHFAGEARDVLSAAATPFGAFVVIGAVVTVLMPLFIAWPVMCIVARERWNRYGGGAVFAGLALVVIALQVAGSLAAFLLPLGIILPDGAVTDGHLTFTPMIRVLWGSGGVEGTAAVVGVGQVLVEVAVMVGLTWWGARSIDRHLALR